MEGFLNLETLRGLAIIFLLIWFLSGKWVRVLNMLIRRAAGLDT